MFDELAGAPGEPADPYTIRTYSGRLVDPWDMKPEDVVWLDVVQALSHTNRFLGHTARPMSVARHSLEVSRILEEQGASSDLQLAGLLHDASEAYLGDVPRPLKRRPEYAPYREAEARCERAIAVRAGLTHLIEEGAWPAEVKAADVESYKRERAVRFDSLSCPSPTVAEVQEAFYAQLDRFGVA